LRHLRNLLFSKLLLER